MTDPRDWDSHWLARCRLNATMSTCLTRQVGAVAVRDRRSFADGFNGNVPGAMHCTNGGCPRCLHHAGGVDAHGEVIITDDRSGRDLDVCVCVHAEMNVIAYCAREGIRTRGATMYTTTMPCLDCSKLIVSAGFTAVVYDEPYDGGGLNLLTFWSKVRRFGHA